MRAFRTPLFALLGLLALTGCSVFGDVSVKEVPFEVLITDGDYEVRRYERLTLVSTDMPEGMGSASSPFYKLFDYISGNNDKTQDIAMTAPVIMNQAGPTTDAMSFVLPVDLSLNTAPTPIDSDVKITELHDYTVAVIRFSGFLNQDTISTHLALLETWIADRGLTITGEAKAAGYNPPFTLPFLRRNEALIPVKGPF